MIDDREMRMKRRERVCFFYVVPVTRGEYYQTLRSFKMRVIILYEGKRVYNIMGELIPHNSL